MQSDLELLDLPYEKLLEIILNLPDLESINNFCLTSRSANQICRDEYFWHLRFIQDFGESIKPVNMTWKEYYRITYAVEPSPPISAGWKHYGIIDNTGKLYMGGRGTEGQIGGGKSKDLKKRNNSPTLIPFDSRVICISCSYKSSAIVTEDGRAYMWGGFQGNVHRSPILITITAERQALKISIRGGGYVILLKNRSIYYFMMHNNLNEEGYIENYRFRDIVLAYLPGIWFMAITEDYQVYSYGYGDNDNQLTEKKIICPERIRHILTYYENIMALSLTGNLYVLGKGDEGQLGTGDLSSSDTPVKINIQRPIKSISLGERAMAAITEDGRLYMWGHNEGERIINRKTGRRIGTIKRNLFGRTMYSDYVIATPTEISPFDPSSQSKRVLAVAVGGYFSMILTDDGEVRVWGQFPSPVNH
jgi:alpha-tubulin suppressor-like RCC1 family protein